MSSTQIRSDSISLARAPKDPVALTSVAVLLHPDDEVAVAKISLLPGTQLILDDGSIIRVAQLIPMGHKVALVDVPYDGVVHKYGQIIGWASQDITAGQHVHTQNLGIKELDLDYAFSEDYEPVELVPEAQRRTFMGFRRADGRVGTRNYVAVLASVNCSSSATARIAEYFPPARRHGRVPECRWRHRASPQGWLRRTYRLARSLHFPADPGRYR